MIFNKRHDFKSERQNNMNVSTSTVFVDLITVLIQVSSAQLITFHSLININILK